jgi:hypothetical protein
MKNRWRSPRTPLELIKGPNFWPLWDVLLAFAMWGVAFVLHGILGRWPLSAVAIASIVPNVATWIGVRAALGLYPGYGLDPVEELRRQSYALLAILTIITVFAFASQLGNSLPRVFLFAWALGLLLAAPAVRQFVKASLPGGVGQEDAQAMTRVVEQANEGGPPGKPAISPVITEEAAKEQELLEALGRVPTGELTAAGAALETSLTVEEADRMLFRLAAKGHLRVRTREGRGPSGLFYSFWPRV